VLYFITPKKMEWRERGCFFIYKHKHVPFTRGGVLERMYQTPVHLIRVPHVLSSCYLRSCQGSKWLDRKNEEDSTRWCFPETINFSKYIINTPCERQLIFPSSSDIYSSMYYIASLMHQPLLVHEASAFFFFFF
jgi:hypothetical protein